MNMLSGSGEGSCDTRRTESLTEELLRRKGDLEAKLKDIENALRLLKKSPELQELFDCISRVRHF